VPPAVSVAVDGVNRIADALPLPSSAFFGVPSVNAESGAAVAMANPQYWLTMTKPATTMVPET
jgi:hypothetical protein